MNRKIYVVGGDNGYASWMEGTIVSDIKDADLVVFTGGEDVSPHLYDEPNHPATGNNRYRDAREMEEWVRAYKDGKKLIGICRGAQFLCVMAGGKLVQDQQMQPSYHDMQTIDGRTIRVSSTHHQAQHPWNLPTEDFSLIGFTHGLCDWHEDGNQKEIVNFSIEMKEVEVCYYPKIKALGIQPHPEYYFGRREPHFKESIAYFQDLLNRHMEDKL